MEIDYTKDTHWIVYAHINKINGKYYIGITGRRPERRWGTNGIGYSNKCTHFWRAIQKYGWDNFDHEIIASNLTKQEAANFEKLLIAKLRSNQREYGYNISAGGTGGNNKDVFPVRQYDLDGNFIAEYESAAEAARVIGCHRSAITGACKHHGVVHGYMFRYANEVVDGPYLRKGQKPVLQFALNGKFICEYPSCQHASRATGIAANNISRAAKEQTYQSCGFLWIYKEDYETFGLKIPDYIKKKL